MKNYFTSLIIAVMFGAAASARAQDSSQQSPQNNAPVYRITMVGKSITAVSYQHRGGTTTIGFEGTPLLPSASGQAQVDSKQGRTQIKAEFKDLLPAQRFGSEFLTYVLWAITPQGRPYNLGEVLLNGKNSKIEATTPLQAFGMIVTAEPYYAVPQPSNAVILENVALSNTVGTIGQVRANYELLDRSQYSYNINEENQRVAKLKSNPPLELLEAENAVAIAQQANAEQYAPDPFASAQRSLNNAESIFMSKGDKRQVIAAARDAVQNASDARMIAVRKQQDQQIAAQQAAAAQRAEEAKEQAAASAAKQQEAEAARERAEEQQRQAEQQAAEQEQAREEAQQKSQQAQAAAAQAAQAAEQAHQAAALAQQQQQQLRATLLQQFNRILPTTDTPRGLQVNMADVLFETSKYDLSQPAREALAKLSGIILAHPGLKLEIDGYTDSTGSEDFNQTLSEKRANAVRDYLVQEGLEPNSVTAQGFGQSNPVASNDTRQGRQQNRRVNIIISGDVIGTPIGSNTTPQQQKPQTPQQ